MLPGHSEVNLVVTTVYELQLCVVLGDQLVDSIFCEI